MHCYTDFCVGFIEFVPRSCIGMKVSNHSDKTNLLIKPMYSSEIYRKNFFEVLVCEINTFSIGDFRWIVRFIPDVFQESTSYFI